MIKRLGTVICYIFLFNFRLNGVLKYVERRVHGHNIGFEHSGRGNIADRVSDLN